ncbi:MAG: carbon starvation CstA family protein [bacterium JZ-2024 1]
MALSVIAGIFIVALLLAYRYYGAWVAREYRLQDDVPTPAVRVNDGVDFVPAPPFYLLGQHFSAIAAAGPIAGPILAVQAFGWLPALLWIGLGVILIGAVHDFSALVASVRHEARSIAEIIRIHIGKPAYIAVMTFIWIALLYVIIAFADITAGTYVGKTEEFAGQQFLFNPGGAVAFSSIAYLLLAVVMGIIQKKLNPPLWLMTLIFVPATLFVVWLGTRFSTLFILPHKTWAVLILTYCFVASLLPVWLLLQPRGYLGGFVLYLVLAIGTIGIFSGRFAIHQPYFKTWHGASLTDILFPFLFVTIACGAVSGFHGLVCSGTTSKQISRETHIRLVGYGGMLLEGFVALIALATIMIFAQQAQMPAPGKIYGDGIGRFLTILIGEKNLYFAMTFGAMAFSTFVFDTLDVVTRLGRYILQELFNWRGNVAAVTTTALTIAIPMYFLLDAPAGSYRMFWTLFGTSNQLLGALTLTGIVVWLKRSRIRTWFVAIPAIFLMSVTLTALLLQMVQGFSTFPNLSIPFLNGIISLVLTLLALFVLTQSFRAYRLEPPPAPISSKA